MFSKYNDIKIFSYSFGSTLFGAGIGGSSVAHAPIAKWVFLLLIPLGLWLMAQESHKESSQIEYLKSKANHCAS